MGSAGATLLGSFSGATGTIGEAGFIWADNSADVEAGNGTPAYDDTCLGNVASGSISAQITSLAPLTTYYYRAFVAEYNESTSTYDYHFGNVRSFTTESGVAYTPAGWLELPEVTGTEDFVGRFYGSGGNAGTNRNYSYYYNYTYYASMWVAYPLCGTHKSGSASSSWSYNPNVDQNKQVNVKSNSYGTMYNNNTYSRGHQCPNADRKSNDQMNEQTYYLTNQTPQRQDKFNGSIWGSLETATRNLVSSAADTVYVVTGPVYRKVGGAETINYLTGAAGKSANPSSLPIPNYFWKALLKVRRNGAGQVTNASAIGFWFPHRDYENGETYTQFVVSVDQIEEWTGLDLFTNLHTTLETHAEANTNWSTFQSF